jgi:peptide chain release factor 2
LPPWRARGNVFKISWCVFDLTSRETTLQQLEIQSQDPNLWDNPESAQHLMKQLARLRAEIEGWRSLENRINDTLELASLRDPALEQDIIIEIEAIETALQEREMMARLSGPYDSGNAILAIHAGAGGTDSQDWAQMLQRMYLRWAERHDLETEILDLSEGEEAGIKSVTISVEGRYAYGYLKPERGVHRLVRLSPFDSAHRRHTSFAMVEVYPQVEADDEVAINPADLRIDTYRSAGAGGQNVQKNETAIRITHLPTGLVVTCQNERSQTQNKENAMRVLRARLLDLQRRKQEEQLAEIRGDPLKAEWGSQIRSYVLHPYQLVKDHRTDYETGNTEAVLDGEIDDFIEAYLSQSVGHHR